MTLNEIDDMVPDDIDAAMRAASAMMPAKAWDLDGLKAKAHPVLSRRRWPRARTGIIAGAVAAVLAGSVVAVGAGSPQGVSDEADVSVLATDVDHLYAARTTCADSCASTLFGSDDGGTTWTVRASRDYAAFRLMAGPDGALLSESADEPGNGTTVSTDGGRTWKSVVDDPQPWPTMPAGGILTCGHAENCLLSATDPLTGRSSPLPRQPPANSVQHMFTVRGVIWLDGGSTAVERTTRSRDGGKVWTTEANACTTPACDDRLVPGLDGSTVYRIRATSTDPGTVIGRSRNAGASWESFPVTAGATGTSPGTARTGQAAAVVTPDNTLVAFQFDDAGGKPVAWKLGPADLRPEPVQLSGLPEDIGTGFASSLTGTADTGYLLKPNRGATVYRSLDGLVWWPLTLPAP